jgi:SAM-dependent methyltransferase
MTRSTPPGAISSPDTPTTDKASPEYWSRLWAEGPPPRPIDPGGRTPKNYVNRRFHAYFRRAFSGLETAGACLLELGCARSAWLPYFHREFGFHITGLDYSEIGCAQARAVLAAAGVSGEVVYADLFAPPPAMLEKFDVVVSFGLVEHFSDTAAALGACARFLKPGGMMITTVPNLSGWLGAMQRRLDRAVYDIHLPLDREQLAEAHKAAGLDPIACDYFMFANWQVINVQRFRGHLARLAFKIAAAAPSRAIWFVESLLGDLPSNPKTSPYIIAYALRPS